MTTLAVVFGAGGRLGRTLLPRLAGPGLTTVSVTRHGGPAQQDGGFHQLRIDLMYPRQRARGRSVLEGLARDHESIALLDLVLDRHSVTTMRRSIAASTTFVLGLGGYLRMQHCQVSYVLASTTAALAPWVFQTPYGIAKKRQLAAYLTDASPTAAVLLPALAFEPSCVSSSAGWSYSHAADVLARHVEAPITSSRLLVPAPRGGSHIRSPNAWAGGLAQLASLTWRRDSPEAHRQASRTRLRLVPVRWRPKLDHHGAPEGLVQGAARQYRVQIARSDL